MSSSRFRRASADMNHLFNKFEDILLMGIFGCMLFFAVLQIVQRNTTGGGPAWTEELLCILVLWLALVGSAAASRNNNHIQIDLISRHLPPRYRQITHAAAMLFTCAVCGMVTWYAWKFVQGEREAASTVLKDIPAWMVQIILPTGFGVVTVRYFIQFLVTLTHGVEEKKLPS